MTKQELFAKVDDYKNKINAIRPFSSEQEIELDKLQRIKLSNYLKLTTGNALAESDTEIYDYILSQAGTEQLDITEDIMKHLHFIMYHKVNKDEAGQYRTNPIDVSGAKYTPAAPEDVPRLMEHFINQMQNSKRMMHPIEYASMCHKRLADIHPFNEGNDTVALLILNLILVNEGYGVAVISQKSYKTYEDALALSRRKMNPDIDMLINFIAACILESQKDYCRLLGID